MTASLLTTYIPEDRLNALKRGAEIDGKFTGSVLFADISGFTKLTESLTHSLGTRRGAEELTRQINNVYSTLITEINRYGGSVIHFAGDAMTCWFEGDETKTAASSVACAIGMQNQMKRFSNVSLPNGDVSTLAIKVSIATGTARRFVVGDPDVQLFDVLAGNTVTRVALGGEVTRSNEVVIDRTTEKYLSDRIDVLEWRHDADQRDTFAVVGSLRQDTKAFHQSQLLAGTLPQERLRPWIIPALYDRVTRGLGEFLTELRPTVVLFLRFDGIDFELDDQCNLKLDTFIRWIQTIIGKYDGNILQLIIGDKGSYLYVVFGAPIAHEDDARRAVRVAAEITGADISPSYISKLQIGISSGTMRTGSYGGITRRTYGVLGNDVNVSARLMQLAESHQVLVSSRMQKETSMLFNWKKLGQVNIKGVSESIPVYQLMASNQYYSIDQFERTSVTPMIGRNTEKTLILDRIARCIDREGQVIGITADAGVGKSRLLAEIIHESKKARTQIFAGACESFGKNMPYLAWRPIWHHLFELRDENDLTKIKTALQTLDQNMVDRLPLLGALFNLHLEENAYTSSLDPEARKSVLEITLIEYIKYRADRAREQGSHLIIVLEDIHWIDRASFDLLEIVARSVSDCPISIIVTCRASEIDETLLKRIFSLPNFVDVKLGELDSIDAESLIRSEFTAANLGNIDSQLLSQILKKSQGNPFFIEEMINLIRDTYIGSSDILALSTVNLPESLHSLILSRLDKITERQRITLKTASIIGRSFRFQWLHGYYPGIGDNEPVLQDLEDLCRLSIILPDQQPNLTYFFKHIITQEVTYESLPYSQRAILHEKFADYLESIDPNRHVDLLAYHYQHSMNLVKKLKYLRLAGEDAAARYANNEAIQYFSSALDAIPHDQVLEHFQLLRAREAVYSLLGERDHQDQDIAQMEHLAESLDDYERQAFVALRRAVYYGDIGEHAEAINAAHRASLLADAVGNNELVASALLEWGKSQWREAEFTDAEETLQRALVAAADIPRIKAHCLRNLAIVSIRCGNYEKGRQFSEQSLAVFQSISDTLGEALVLKDLGNVAFLQGNWSNARKYYGFSIPLFQKVGQRLGESDVLNNLAIVADDQGDVESAILYLKQSLRIKREIGDRRGQGSVLINLGEFATRQGNYDDARTYYVEALDRIRETNSRLDEGLVLHNMAMVAHFLGDSEHAQSLYEDSLKLKRETGDKAGESETLAYLGLLHCRRGDNNRAVKFCQDAIAIAREVDAGIEEGCALLHLGHTLINLGDIPGAAEAYQQAFTTRQELGQEHRAIEALAGMAQAAYLLGSVDIALERVNMILNYLESKSPDGFDEPIRVYLICHRILQHMQDSRAQYVIQQANRFLNERAGKVSNEEERRIYLNNNLIQSDLYSGDTVKEPD
jgi:class 3 adenylate cyclase/tetratricopeptide (TPR) repeat protein